MPTQLKGGCSCGQVRYWLQGAPIRTGVCHCTDCRHETGSAFLAFAIYPSDQFGFEGETSAYRNHHFCPACGTRLFSYDAGEPEVEIKLGSLDEAPTDLNINYELWIRRREPWLRPIEGAEQHWEDRPKQSN